MRSAQSTIDRHAIDLVLNKAGVWSIPPRPLLSPRLRLAILSCVSWLCFSVGFCILAIWSFGGGISTLTFVLAGFPLVIASHLIETIKYPQR